jgi:tetratricopeptide (TPR) repeat protein
MKRELLARMRVPENPGSSGAVRRPIHLAFLALFLSGFALVALAAGQAGHEGHASGGPVPREILERPVPLRQGTGSVHEAVTTSSPEAQAFYDQGLAYLHSFVWIEAARSFHQALRLDPKLVMAYLGLTDTYIGLQDIATARSAFQRAQELAPTAGDRERMWITIRDRELDYLENSADQNNYALYRQALKEALKLNPNDPWLWIQRALADESSPFTHGQAGGVDTLSFYKTAVTLAPGNSAAHHYYAHSYENAGRAKEALSETEIYLRMAPAIPHAHHMRGHELLQVGRTEEAIHEFLKTRELEDEYYRAENIPARYDWHHAHNLQLLAMSYQSLGQMKSAETAFREAYTVPASTDFLEFNRKCWPEFLLGRGRFEEALEASQQLIKSQWALARLAGHTLAGQALLGMDRIDEARDQLNLAERETEQIPVGTLAVLPYPGALWASILLREKKTEEGEALTKDIEKMVRAMPGPDAWSAARFELESIERTSRQAGDWDLAEFTAQQMIQHDPSYAGGYFAMGLTLQHSGDGAKARQQFAMAEKLWSKADRDLPELGRIHEKVSALR